MKMRRLLIAGVSAAVSLSVLPGGAVRSPRPAALHEAIAERHCGSDARCVTAAVRSAVAPIEQAAARGGLTEWLRTTTALRAPVAPQRAYDTLPAADAILALYDAAGIGVDRALRTRVHAQVRALSPAAARETGELVGAVVAANRLVERAIDGSSIRRIDPGVAMRLASIVGSAPPGSVAPRLRARWAHVQRVLASVNMDLIAEASLIAGRALTDLRWPKGGEELNLPFIFIGGAGDTEHTEDRIILVDESGNDTYSAIMGASPVAGVGVGLARDMGGDDVYDTLERAQGFALGGVGILLDEGGDDLYSLTNFGQGTGVGGVGVLYDAGASDDRYLSPYPEGGAPIGKIAAALGGIGLLVDEGGSDVFNQDGLDGLIWAAAGLSLLASLGQGDDAYVAHATDNYLLEDFLGRFAGPVQVSAEVNGVAILYEEGGDDTYTCGEFVRQGCQGTAGVGSLGLLWDVAGDDTYWMGDSFSVDAIDDLCGCDSPSPMEHPIFPMGQGAGYNFAAPPGLTPTIGVLYDEAGADSYTAARWAQGYGTFGGNGVLYDTGGAPDAYQMQAPFDGERADGQTWIDGVVGIGRDE